MSLSTKIRIAARLRPPIAGEVNDEGIQITRSKDGTSCISVNNPRDPTQVFNFPFTSCYDHTATQAEIFSSDVLPMLDIVYSGVTVTVFAYGVTSSGKTHTMQGSRSEPGVIPRVVEALFQKKSNMEEYDISLAVSYMEIYKDEVYDLLVNRETAPKLPVRENDVGQVFVANLTALPMEKVEDFDQIYARATKNRSVASTNLNRASSRSHAILTISTMLVDAANSRTLTGKINLVDLAGSENNKITGNDPARMAESAAINKSLSVLGQVVHALNQGASRIPYRNSKLTRILQDALGGTSMGLLICNLAPGVKFRQDTLNTLNFAVRTKNIENKPVIHEKENRPLTRPALTAIHTTIPIINTSTSSAGSSSSVNSGSRRPSIATSSRPSTSMSSSRVPRPSMTGNFASLKPNALAPPQARNLTDEDLDQKIAKLVEAEVARRLEERERERAEEEARKSEEKRKAAVQEQQSLPSGVLTPLLRRHQDLDGELRKRLEELEQRFEEGNKEVQMADVLSPVSRKRTGRAYVALARSHSEKNNLQLALELYRKAETYVPDNIKLKERIIEIEWAVKHGKSFQPSPKHGKKHKSKKSKSATAKSRASASCSNEDGTHRSNHGDVTDMKKQHVDVETSYNSQKRHAEGNHIDDSLGTPARRHKKGRRLAEEESDRDDRLPHAPTKRSKQRAEPV